MTRIDRRALFTSGAAAALLAATGVTLAARPKRGGRLRLAVARDTGALAQVRDGALFETLTEIAPDGTLRPELAQSWQSDSTARIWDIHLCGDALFHDGQAFRAADAVASLADLPGAHVSAVSAQSLRIELDEPDADLPLHLADMAYAMRPQDPARHAAQIGTGLYRMQRHEDGRHFLAQRVESHPRDGHAGWFDSVDVVVIPDAAVRAEALRDGFVDVAEMPLASGLLEQGEFAFHPSQSDLQIAARAQVGVPPQIGARAALDDGRLAQRWWMG